MNDKAVAVFCCSLLVIGLCLGLGLGRIIALPVKEIQVIDKELTLDGYVSVLRDYYSINVTKKSYPEPFLWFGELTETVPIVSFDVWVRFLQAHGIKECYRLKTRPALWVEVEDYIYEWSLE